ncbi:phage minor capsid protein [Lysinibacillus sp. NPDC096418]|uniref:phage minor capsid protein n=1 Tax=Lysinibacillus sp. NPDC096418 TaxID=3364138 RepID=UPI0038181349
MPRPVITPYQFNLYTSQITDIYVALEDELFKQIASRLKTNPEHDKDYVLQWQVEKMQQLRMFNLETIRELSIATGISAETIRQVISDVGNKTVQSVDDEVKGSYKQLPQPTQMDVILEGYVKQAFLELDNYVNQTLITTTLGQGTVAIMYRKIVEETTAQVLAGNKTINQAVTETVIKWAEKGIKTGFVDKAGRTWHLEQYADTVIRNTVNNTYNELRLSRMDEYGIDLVLVNSYADPRPACAKIQGKVCSMSNPSSDPKYPSIYEFGYGEPWGIRGANCRHILYLFIDGLNTNNQIQYDEEEMREQYKLSQQQRYYERQVRKAKRSLNLAEEIGDEEAIQKYKKLVCNRQATVREFVNEHDLARRYDKERIIK